MTKPSCLKKPEIRSTNSPIHFGFRASSFVQHSRFVIRGFPHFPLCPSASTVVNASIPAWQAGIEGTRWHSPARLEVGQIRDFQTWYLTICELCVFWDVCERGFSGLSRTLSPLIVP